MELTGALEQSRKGSHTEEIEKYVNDLVTRHWREQREKLAPRGRNGNIATYATTGVAIDRISHRSYRLVSTIISEHTERIRFEGYKKRMRVCREDACLESLLHCTLRRAPTSICRLAE
jgi:hypothetical protein